MEIEVKNVNSKKYQYLNVVKIIYSKTPTQFLLHKNMYTYIYIKYISVTITSLFVIFQIVIIISLILLWDIFYGNGARILE